MADHSQTTATANDNSNNGSNTDNGNNTVTITHWHEPAREDTSPFISIQETVVDSPISTPDQFLFKQAANPARVDFSQPRNVPPGAAIISRNRLRGDARGNAVVGAVVAPKVRKITPQQQRDSVPQWQRPGQENAIHAVNDTDGSTAGNSAQRQDDDLFGGRHRSKFHDTSIEQIMQERQKSISQQAQAQHQHQPQSCEVSTIDSTNGGGAPPSLIPSIPLLQQAKQSVAAPPQPTSVTAADANVVLRLQETQPLVQGLRPIDAVHQQYTELQQHALSRADEMKQKKAWLLKWEQLRLNPNFTFKYDLSMDDDLAHIRFVVLSTQNEIYLRNGVERTKKMIRGPVKFAKTLSDAFLGHVLDLDGTQTEGGISLMDSIDETLDNSERELETIVSAGGALDVKPTKQQALQTLGMSLITSLGDVVLTNNCDKLVGIVTKKLNLGPAKAKKEKEEKKRLKKQKKEEEEALARKKAYDDMQMMFYRSMPPPPQPSTSQYPYAATPMAMPVPMQPTPASAHYYVPQPFYAAPPPAQPSIQPQFIPATAYQVAPQVVDYHAYFHATPAPATPMMPQPIALPPQHQQQQQQYSHSAPQSHTPTSLPPQHTTPPTQQSGNNEHQSQQQPSAQPQPPYSFPPSQSVSSTPAAFSLVPPVPSNSNDSAAQTNNNAPPPLPASNNPNAPQPRRKFPTLNMPSLASTLTGGGTPVLPANA